MSADGGKTWISLGTATTYSIGGATFTTSPGGTVKYVGP